MSKLLYGQSYSEYMNNLKQKTKNNKKIVEADKQAEKTIYKQNPPGLGDGKRLLYGQNYNEYIDKLNLRSQLNSDLEKASNTQNTYINPLPIIPIVSKTNEEMINDKTVVRQEVETFLKKFMSANETQLCLNKLSDDDKIFILQHMKEFNKELEGRKFITNGLFNNILEKLHVNFDKDIVAIGKAYMDKVDLLHPADSAVPTYHINDKPKYINTVINDPTSALRLMTKEEIQDDIDLYAQMYVDDVNFNKKLYEQKKQEDEQRTADQENAQAAFLADKTKKTTDYNTAINELEALINHIETVDLPTSGNKGSTGRKIKRLKENLKILENKKIEVENKEMTELEFNEYLALHNRSKTDPHDLLPDLVRKLQDVKDAILDIETKIADNTALGIPTHWATRKALARRIELKKLKEAEILTLAGPPPPAKAAFATAPAYTPTPAKAAATKQAPKSGSKGKKAKNAAHATTPPPKPTPILSNGKGLIKRTRRVMYGRGLGHVKKLDIEPQKRITWIELGSKMVHKQQLENQGLLNVVYKNKFARYPKFPKIHVSDELKDFVLEMIDNGGRFNERYYNQLNASEKEIFYNMMKACDLQHLLNHNGDNFKQKQQRYEILIGEISAGNDSKQLKQELRDLVIDFMNTNKVNKERALGILYEYDILNI